MTNIDFSSQRVPGGEQRRPPPTQRCLFNLQNDDMLARVHETATPHPAPGTRDEAADAMLRSSKPTNIRRDSGSNKTREEKGGDDRGRGCLRELSTGQRGTKKRQFQFVMSCGSNPDAVMTQKTNVHRPELNLSEGR